VTAENKTQKIDGKILKELEKSDSVRVMIKYKEDNQKRLFSKQTQIVPEEKIRHQFGGKFSATLTKEEILSLEDNSLVESVEIVGKKYLFLQESVPLINGTETHQIQIQNQNLTGKGQTVCILDTGVDFTHPDLQGQNVTCNIDCISGANCFSNCSLGDNNGHGTHVAGIVAANGSIKGVAPGAKIASVTVCNTSGCWNNDIEAGIQWCINNQENYNISVISMSFGGQIKYSNYCDNSDNEIAQGIDNAVNQNIFVTVATGNEAWKDGIASPACIKNSTRIGNLYDKNMGEINWNGTCTDSNTFIDKIVCHTNRASFFSDIFFTYGAIINSTYINQGYEELGGTSMSTPMAAGMIAILKQYKKQESNKTLTNEEIKEILYNSSEKINDTEGTQTNFSKLNSLNIILYADEQAPNITYMFPPNNSLKEPQNQSFTCNATDLLQFANLTIEIYNSTSLIHNKSTNQNSLTTYINTTIDQEYNWTCTAKDNNSNTETKTFFLTSSPIQTQIISPANNTFTNQNQTEFNCSAETTKELSNITFFIYENNSLIYNRTHEISGTKNYSLFEYTLEDETTYKYNCLAINNLSEKYQTKNNTITLDETPPKINLTSPQNNTRTQQKEHEFKYNQTETNKDYCNLTINNQIKSSFTQTLSDGTYHWNVTCTDLANNWGISETYKLIIYTEETPERSSSSSSSDSSTPEPIIETKKEIEIIPEEIKKGTIKEMNKIDNIKFQVKNKTHNLTINSINTNKINITIQSNPFNLILYQYQPRKINLDNDKTYDLELILLSIQNESVKIFFQELNETIPIKQLFEEPKNETEPKEESKITNIFLQKIKNFFQNIFNFIKKFKLFPLMKQD
jgi:hypothetical protein